MNTDADTDDPVADTNPASDNDSTGMASDDDPHATGGDAHSTLPPPPQAPPRRLVRSDDRRLGGVAGGVAEYFDIDPVIVRLAFVIAVFAGGTGLIAYAVAWLVIPDSDGEPRRGTSRNVDRSTVLALALLAIAAAIGISDVFDDGFVTPVVLIAAGVYLLHQRPFDRAQAPSTPTTWTSAASSGPDPAGATIVAADPDTPTADRLIPTWQPGDGRPPPPPTTQPPRPEPPNRGPAVVTRFALSLISLWFAAAIAVDALDWIEGDASTVVAVALVIVGVAGIAAGFFGGGRGLVPIGILLSLTFAVTLVVEPVLEDGVGDREHTVTDLTELEPAYRLGIGQLVLDLSQMELAAGQTATVEVELGIGRAEVLVPPGVDLQLEGDVGVGELVLVGQSENGVKNELSVDQDAIDTSATIVIDMSVGIGSGRVDRG